MTVQETQSNGLPVMGLSDPRRMTCLEAHRNQVANSWPIPGGSYIYQPIR
jgi:hypothetical protein